MYLTKTEHEAFVRGQAAGLIPVDRPFPVNADEMANLIFHIGVLFSAKIACRRHDGTLRVLELTTFTAEYLDKLIRNLPQILSRDILTVTSYRQDTEPNMLGGLYNYFSFGRDIVDAEDLTGRLTMSPEILTTEQVLKGFEIEYVPVKRTGMATLRQRAVLAEMIYAQRLPTIARRDWENMTKGEATRLITSVPKPKAELPNSVSVLLNAIERLNVEDRQILSSIIHKKEKSMQIVNDRKFASLNEIAACLNRQIDDPKRQYRLPELACAWANTRARYYQTTGKKVEEGVHYLSAGEEQLLSEEACRLIEELATVDAHNVPIMSDGVAILFTE